MLRGVLDMLPAGQKIRGVVHCAGRLADGTLLQQSWSSFVHVAGPKVAGALALHQAFKDQDLEAFILFSSAAAVIGSAGQANYAAANAILGAIARMRRAQGQVALCIDWGPWTEGMAAEDRVARRTFGLVPLRPQTAFAGFERLLDHSITQASVLPVASWSTFLRCASSGAARPILCRSCCIS